MSSMSFFHQGLGERRRREVERVNDMTAKDTTVSGRHLVSGAGDVTFDVAFPVTFAHRPVPHFDGELDEGFSPVSGAPPGVVGCVVGWQVTGKVDGAFDGYFTGATISARCYGDPGQRIWVHWSFRGVGLRNPVRHSESVDEAI